MNIIRVLFMALIFAMLSFTGQAQSLPGDVVDVIDGKTIVLSIPTGKVTVELQYIDVPAEGQPMFDTVRNHLRKLILKKRVDYRARALSFDRTIGQIFLGNVDISQQMLRDGAAWHMPSELSGQERSDFLNYASIESSAKKEKRGVWSKPNLRPSWEYAAGRRENIASTKPVVASARQQLAKPGYWGDKNPKMGDIGALFNGYNAVSKKGYLSSGLLGFQELNGITPFTAARVALDVTFYYKEEKSGRTGDFVITLLATSEKGYFSDRNDLILYDDERTLNLGKPKRTTTRSGDQINETLRYVVSAKSMQKMINTEGANLRIKDLVIYLIGTKYILYNMVELSK